MGERLGRTSLFTIGAVLLGLVLAVSLPGRAPDVPLLEYVVAEPGPADDLHLIARAPQRIRDMLHPETVAGVEEPPSTGEPEPEVITLTVSAPARLGVAATVASESPHAAARVATPVARASATAQIAPPSLEPPPTSGIVIASWYGPGFYGNRTACGQTYTPELVGVAHRTLPCGTMLVLTYGVRTVTVPVIDRGPFIAGRTLDLSNATRQALGCPDLCTLSMRPAG